MDYFVIGGDGNEYGPATRQQIEEWIAQGRLNGDSQLRESSSTIRIRLGAMPEFAAALAAKAGGSGAAMVAAHGSVPDGTAHGAGDIDVGRAVSTGFEIFKQNAGPLIGGTFVYAAVVISATLPRALLAWLVEISGEGSLVPLISLILFFPLYLCEIAISAIMGVGFTAFILTFARGGSASISDVFRYFTEPVQPILLIVVMSPIIMLGTLLCLVPGIYLGVAYMFAMPLLADRKVDFWTAMETSRKTVTPVWFSVALLTLAGAAIAFAGLLLCGVGSLASVPIASLALMVAYDDLFGGRSRLPAHR